MVHLDIAHAVYSLNWLKPGLEEQHVYLTVTYSESHNTDRPYMAIVKVRK